MSITSDGQNTDEVRRVFLPSVGDQNSPALGIATLGLLLLLGTALQWYNTDEGECPLEFYTLYLLILQLDVVLLHVAVDLCALVTQLLLQAFYQLPWTQIYNKTKLSSV